MPGITLADAEARLAEYQTAETAVLASQSYSIAGRAVTRANLNEIRDGISFWDAKVKRLTRGGIRMRGATPV
ncbi:MAG TPA: hypothetical protein ENG93_03405 [Nitrospirae bacterium]|nr:hypothetical protein [Nitrospirota bacterium]